MQHDSKVGGYVIKMGDAYLSSITFMGEFPAINSALNASVSKVEFSLKQKEANIYDSKDDARLVSFELCLDFALPFNEVRTVKIVEKGSIVDSGEVRYGDFGDFSVYDDESYNNYPRD